MPSLGPFIKGVAGEYTPDSLRVLKGWGANAVRVFNAEALGSTLDMAQVAGLRVVAGLSWSIKKDLTAEETRMVAIVKKFASHPALVCWNVGNEQEGGLRDDQGKVDVFVEKLHRLVKAIKAADPAHAVIYTCIDFGSAKDPPMVKAFRRGTPLDGIGINTYDGAPSLGTRYAAWKLPVPFIATEIGWRPAMRGRETPWSHGRKAFHEMASSDKADHFRAALANMRANRQCAGVMAFRWGLGGTLATDTWHMMLTPRNMRTDVADELIFAWTGAYPTVRAPKITSKIRFRTGTGGSTLETGWRGIVAPSETNELAAGKPVTFRVTAEGKNPLQYRWELREHTVLSNGKVTRGALVTATSTASNHVTFTMPPAGIYRLYVYVEDPLARAAGYASWPFRTTGGGPSATPSVRIMIAIAVAICICTTCASSVIMAARR